jgi:hypothetical protein
VTDEIRTTLRCPQCGGDNPLPAGERLIRCAFCDSTLFVDRSGLVSHYRLARRLDAAAGSEALRRWMAGDRTVKDLDRKATVVSTTAVSFPMWMFRTGSKGSETVLVEPAAPTPIPQVAGLELPAGQLEPYTPEPEAETVAATVPLDTARGWLARAGRGEPTETALVHVPFWRFVYRFGATDYTALVEASTGTVLAGIYPAKAESPYVLVAVLGLLLFGVEGLAITNLLLKLAAYAVTAVPLAGLAWWVTRRV